MYAEYEYDNSLSPADVEDIRTLYRDCRYKRRQIGILADLYLASRPVIMQVLGLEQEPETVGKENKGTWKKGVKVCNTKKKAQSCRT